MDSTDWFALLAGIATIAWVNWYFLLGRRREVSATRGSGAQEVEILVQGGYEPSVIRLRRGVPARLVFNRQDSSSCSEEIVLPEFGLRKFLPAFEKTTVELTPAHTGTFDITCGMAMLHAKLVVED